MTEPVSTALGIKLGPLIAGFAGSVVSLAFVKNLTRLQGAMAVVVGLACSYYLTPVAMLKLPIPLELNNSAAFMVGLLSLNIVPAIKAACSLSVLRAFALRILGLPATPPTQGDGGQQ